MLDTVLPWAQRDFPDKLTCCPDFHAERLCTRAAARSACSAATRAARR